MLLHIRDKILNFAENVDIYNIERVIADSPQYFPPQFTKKMLELNSSWQQYPKWVFKGGVELTSGTVSVRDAKEQKTKK